MKIRIPKSQLLAQLPDAVRTDLIAANDLPDYFDFEAFAAEPNEIKLIDKLKKEYANVYAALTATQWYMFCIMLANPDGAEIKKLGARLTGVRNMPNNVVVHIKDMRQQLKDHSLPYEIINIKGSKFRPGAYKVIKNNK